METKIRVLHVLGRLDRGGAETMIMNLYRNIDRSKIQFDFIIHTDEKCEYHEEIYQLGGKIFSIPRYTGKNHFIYTEKWKEFFGNHPEYKIIHGHMRSTATIYLIIAKKFGLKTIAHSHSIASRGNFFEQMVKGVLQFPIRFIAENFYACSVDAGKWLFGKNVINKNNFKVIRNAIDLNDYRYDLSTRKKMRKLLNLNSKFVVGHVGSYTYPKNHKYIIKVFKEILKYNENSVLLLIGTGELKSEIENTIEKLGIEDKVIILGSISNVNDYLQAMDTFIFPSLFEGLGMAIIEAQAAGLKCFVSDKVPNEVVITDLVTVLPLNSPAEWAEYIIKKNDLLFRNSTQESIAKQGYDIKDQVVILENTYFKLLNSQTMQNNFN